jgi:ParB family transcriptional regulator, chromosome partitioning protein
MKSDKFSQKNIGVKNAPTTGLHANPHNPRQLFDREPMKVLRDSIEKVGILVPLTVYLDSKKNHYVILDGQRRWMCAQELGMESIPINQVAEPSVIHNIITMFQIHKLREDWELMPTALKLEVLMGQLDEKNDKRLAALTGLDQAVVVRCKKLLSYPKKYQDTMLDLDPNKRERADFYIELYAVRNDRVVKKMKWYKKELFTAAMLSRYQNKSSDLRSVTDFRKMKQHITNAAKANKVVEISKRLHEYTKDETLTMDCLVIQGASVSLEADKVVSEIGRLHVQLESLDVERYYGEKKLWDSLEGLLRLLRIKLKEADRRPVK